MQPTFSLRPASEDDISELLKIEKEAYPTPWNESHFRAEMEKPYSRILIMTDDETDSIIAGFVVFWLFPEGCQVLNVAVAEAYRRQGFAKKMLRQVATLALHEGIRKIILEVRKSNQAAIELYQELNFSITQVRKAFYSNGEDAYQMTLELEDSGLRF